jgi:hypothetical protein
MRRTSNHALLLVTCIAASLAACEAPPPEPLPHAARQVVEVERWQVFDGDREVGVLRQLEIRDPKGPIVLYRVEDLEGRWLGHADAAGRFTRRVPFQAEEEELGVWSLPRGVAKLVDATAPVRLEVVARDADQRRR